MESFFTPIPLFDNPDFVWIYLFSLCFVFVFNLVKVFQKHRSFNPVFTEEQILAMVVVTIAPLLNTLFTAVILLNRMIAIVSVLSNLLFEKKKPE